MNKVIFDTNFTDSLEGFIEGFIEGFTHKQNPSKLGLVLYTKQYIILQIYRLSDIAFYT